MKGIIFDFDGTLVLSNAIKYETFLKISEPYQHGLLTMQSVAKDKKKDRFEILQDFCKALKIEAHYQKLLSQYNNICAREIGFADEVMGATEFLDFVKNKLKLKCCLNTATPKSEIIKVLEMRRWSHYFDLVLGKSDGKLSNNLYAAEYFRIQPREWLIVGDSDDDYEGARDFKANFLAVEPLERRITYDADVKVKNFRSIKTKFWSRDN